MTDKKLAANRKNALKSTGPKSGPGKARSSQNSIKHGLLSTRLIIPGLESQEAWEEHLEGLRKSIAPRDYLVELLTLQLALVSWKSFRGARYEAELAAAAVATAELDLNRSEKCGFGKPSDPAKASAEVERLFLIAQTLKRLSSMADGERLDKEVCTGALAIFYGGLPEEVGPISVPGIPADDDDFFSFDNWTAGLLRKAVEVYATVAQMPPEVFRNKCLFSARVKYNTALSERDYLLEKQQQWKLLLERESRSRMLLEPTVLATLIRYGSDCDRSFFRILHEIQRLQASQSGGAVPPPTALDVDLTIHSEASAENNHEIAKRTQLSSLETRGFRSVTSEQEESAVSCEANDPIAATTPPIAEGGTNQLQPSMGDFKVPPG